MMAVGTTGDGVAAATVAGGRGTNDGAAAWQRPRPVRDDRNDESDGVAGRGRPRTDKCTKCQRGCDRRSPKLRRTHAKDGNKILGQRDKLLPALCHRCCARQAHAAVSSLGLAPTAVYKHDSTRAPVSRSHAATDTSSVVAAVLPVGEATFNRVCKSGVQLFGHDTRSRPLRRPAQMPSATDAADGAMSRRTVPQHQDAPCAQMSTLCTITGGPSRGAGQDGATGVRTRLPGEPIARALIGRGLMPRGRPASSRGGGGPLPARTGKGMPRPPKYPSTRPGHSGEGDGGPHGGRGGGRTHPSECCAGSAEFQMNDSRRLRAP